LQFNANYVEVPDDGELNFGSGPFTIDAWVKPQPGQQIQPIVAKLDVNSRAGYFLFIQQDPTISAAPVLTLQIGSTGPVIIQQRNGPPITPGVWNFVAAVVNPPNVTLYVGVGNNLVHYTFPLLPDIPTPNATSTTPLHIGRSPYNPHANGITIDELELYKRALSETEIRGIFNAGSAGKCKQSCPGYVIHNLLAGVDDNFSTANGPEPASPSPGLLAFIGTKPRADFDAAEIDKHFGHTFTIPQGKCIKAAKLEFRAKPLSSSSSFASGNDAIHLGFVNNAGAFVGAQFSAYFGTGNPPPLPSLLGNAWGNDISTVAAGIVFTLDLAALPGGINLIPDLNANRYLDIYVQDDTSIDYLRLVVELCDCPSGDKCVPAPQGLNHWWPFDETAHPIIPTTIAHDIVGGRDGTTKVGALDSAGSPKSVPGKVGMAFEFNGSSAFVGVGDGPGTLSYHSPNSFTIDAWIKVDPNNASGVRPIVDKRVQIGGSVAGYQLFLFDGKLGFQLADGVGANPICGTVGSSCTNYVASTAPTVADGQWHFVAAVIDRASGLITLYHGPENGTLSSVFTGTARANAANNADLLIGKNNPAVSSAGQFFKGAIDELEIFNRALSQAELDSIFKAGSAGKCKAQICAVKFHDLNGDGVQSPPEGSLFGWEFNIAGSQINNIGPVKTDKEKEACWLVPAPGTFTVTETVQAGWTNTTPNPQNVPVQPGQKVEVKFGNKKKEEGKAEICVFKFEDLNGDGVHQPGPPNNEPLIAWTFNVNPGPPTQVTTQAGGGFCFGVPAPGTYTITEVIPPPPPTWIPTTPTSQTVTVTPNQLVNVFFGNRRREEGRCDLAIRKTVDPNPPVMGQPFAFKVEVTNVGNAACPPTTTVTDTLSPGFQVTLFNPNTADGWVCSGPPGIVCNNSTLTLQPGQSSVVFAVVGTFTLGAGIENCAELKNPNDTNSDNNRTCVRVTFVQPPGKCDLAIRKSVSPNPVPSGQPITVTLTLQNVGNAPCPGGPVGTVVQDLSTPGLTIPPQTVAVNQSGGTAAWICTVANNGVTCITASTLPPNYSATFTFTATVTAPGSIPNCATVTNPNDTNLTNNQSCVTITATVPIIGPLCRDVTINLSTGVAPWTVSPGTVGVITNLGPLAGTWVAPTVPVRWIQPTNQATPQMLPGGFYQYNVPFTLPGPLTQYSTITLTGRYAADNTVHQFFVGPVQTAPGGPLCQPANANCFSAWTPFSITAPTAFTAGPNILNVRVYNNPTGRGEPTYTGLAVEATLRAVCRR
jgi:uncharacterized repeat protein (TIGR01451 family)